MPERIWSRIPPRVGMLLAAAEAVEFRQYNPTRAAALYMDLARLKRPGVRAGALLRLARCLRASGKPADAIAVYERLLNDQGDIYAADLDPATGLVISEAKRFNQSYIGSTGFPAAWSPDGRFFVYTRRAHLAYNKSRIASFIIRTEATGEEREVYPVPADAFNQAYPFPNTLKWFPDGRSLLATDFVSGKGLMFRQVDLETGRVKALLDLKEGTKSVWSSEISPDGKCSFLIPFQHRPQTIMIFFKEEQS